MEFALVLLLLLIIVTWFIIHPENDDELDVPDIQPPSMTVEDLQEMTKAELLALAEEKSIVVRPSWNKTRIKVAIIEELGL